MSPKLPDITTGIRYSAGLCCLFFFKDAPELGPAKPKQRRRFAAE
jgi:hypothetical protein